MDQKQQPKPKLNAQACLTAAGVTFQVLSNICFAIATVGVVKKLGGKLRRHCQGEIRE